MVNVNDVEEPAAILAIPDDDDVPALKELLSVGREELKVLHGFTLAGEGKLTPDLERSLTLEQELQAQLNKQRDDDE